MMREVVRFSLRFEHQNTMRTTKISEFDDRKFPVGTEMVLASETELAEKIQHMVDKFGTSSACAACLRSGDSLLVHVGGESRTRIIDSSDWVQAVE